MGERPNRFLTKEDIQMINTYMKRCSTTNVLRKLKMKTRYYCTPVGMAQI